jgi:hypothetical protein
MNRTSIAIVVTFIVTSLGWYVVTSLREALEATWLISAVKAPGRMALNAIQYDLAAGKYKSAAARLDLLQKSWARFEKEDGYVGMGLGNIMVEYGNMAAPVEGK